MTLGHAFWFLMLLWLVLGAAPHVRARSWPAGSDLVPFLAVCCAGWALFGPPVQ